jgi:thiamine biosynthesis lipoprotein
MGSIYMVKIAGAPVPETLQDSIRIEIETRLKDVNREISHYDPDSQLSRFNRGPANQPLPVASGFAGLVRWSLDLNRRSAGAYDPTLGPIIALWGFGESKSERRIPDAAELRKALDSTGCGHLSISTKDELTKDQAGIQLNLSSAGKGYGVDAMARVLSRRGLTNFYVAISGDVVTSGLNGRGQPWQVGIPAPLPDWRPGDPVVTVLSISGLAISTSGDYQKYFVDAQGRRLSHIFDPRTGWPVNHNLGSVTVVADSCQHSSSLATTLFVLGGDAGLKWIEGWTNAAALFVLRQPDGSPRVVASSRFSALTGYKP